LGTNLKKDSIEYSDVENTVLYFSNYKIRKDEKIIEVLQLVPLMPKEERRRILSVVILKRSLL